MSEVAPVEDRLRLEGRVALVTGAGQGLGRAIAHTFARAGADLVVVNDLFEDRAAAVAKECNGLGSRGLAAQGDVCNWADMERVVASSERAMTILVNNAGIPPMPAEIASRVGGKLFVETSPEDWKVWVDVNLYGSLNCSRLCLPGMLEQGWGRIISIISDAARVGEKKMVAYGAAKAAVAGMTRCLAKEVAPRGVTVNAVAIGTTLTPTVEQGLSRETLERVARYYPVGRLGAPADIVSMVLLLASNAGSWITGQTIAVNGGYSVTL